MKQFRLYTDENVPKLVVDSLRAEGCDVLTAVQDGRAGGPDDLLLQRAGSLCRVVITHDRRDFRRLHKAGAPHAGMVLCTEDRDAERLAASIVSALAGHPVMRGKLLNVYRPVVAPSR